jgi:hypothetical protein
LKTLPTVILRYSERSAPCANDGQILHEYVQDDSGGRRLFSFIASNVKPVILSPMPRPRWVFKFAVAVSLAVCLATAALWVRSYHREDRLWPPLARTWSIESTRGQITIEWTHPDLRLAIRDHARPFSSRSFVIGSFSSERLDRYGTEFGYPVGTTVRWRFGLNDWFLVLLFGVLPAVQVIRRRAAARRFGAGRCRRCGYDLRATPDRCPECGEDAKSSVEATV